jgi:hypothetical protein
MGKHMAWIAVVAFMASVVVGALSSADKQKDDDLLAGWTSDFAAEKSELVSTGRSPWFILEPGYVATFQEGDEELTVTVKNETKKVDGVECRVVEEKETKAGKLIELSNNYFAISKRTNSIYYFGEDAGGAWLSGEKGARFGLMMPGLPLVKARHFQEIAPVWRWTGRKSSA